MIGGVISSPGHVPIGLKVEALESETYIRFVMGKISIFRKGQSPSLFVLKPSVCTYLCLIR